MKFEAVTNELKEAVKAASSAKPKSGHILIEAENGKVAVTGYDLKLMVRTSVEAETKANGSCAIDAGTLGGLLSRCSGTYVTIDIENSVATVSSGSVKYNVSADVIDAEDYAKIPEIKNVENECIVTCETLLDMISKTQWATRKGNGGKEAFSCVAFDVVSRGMAATAADGTKAAYAHGMLELGSAEPFRFLIPKYCVDELKKDLSLYKSVKITLLNRSVFFEFGTYKDEVFTYGNRTVSATRVYGDLIDSTRFTSRFGDVRRMLTVDKQPFAKVVGRVALLSSAGEKMLAPIELDVNPDRINLTCKSALGNASDTVRVYESKFKEEPMKIGCNPVYLQAAIGAVPGDKLVIGLTAPTMPIVIKPEATLENWMFVVMPVALKAETQEEDADGRTD